MCHYSSFENHCGIFEAIHRKNILEQGIFPPQSDCLYRCGSNKNTLAGEKQLEKKNMREISMQKNRKRTYKCREKTQKSRAMVKAKGQRMQSGRGRIQKQRAKPNHYHKIFVHESRPKNIPNHRIIFTVV